MRQSSVKPGQRFNMLVTVCHIISTIGGKAKWRFLCDCGMSKVIQLTNVQCGYVVSCGCYRKAVMVKYNKAKKNDK